MDWSFFGHTSILLIFIYSTIPVLVSAQIPSKVFKLDLDDDLSVYWSYNWEKKWIKFQIEAQLRPNEWFAFGFSDRGTFINADYCLYHPSANGERALTDVWINEQCDLEIDFLQDCHDFNYEIEEINSTFVFLRNFDTCDKRDYIFEEGTTHIVWAVGQKDLFGGAKLCDQIEGRMIRTTLLRVEIEPNYPPDAFAFTATVPDISVPDQDTTYWCYLTQLPETLIHKKHHIIAFQPVIKKENLQLVHHMELFHCENLHLLKWRQYSGPCNKKLKSMEVCKKVLAAWAMGASPFNYPDNVGLPVGAQEATTHVMLEIHYNNPTLKGGVIDNSGLKIIMTPTLRKYDAGVMELGLEYTDKMAIPPLQEHFQLTGHCIAECTSVGMPFDGIWIFASQLHTHLAGVKVETVLVRNGAEIKQIDGDNHYSPHYQEIRLLRNKVYVFAGNALYTRCTYNTVSRTEITLGGFSTSEEMCVNYIYYYPKVALEVCKSSISDNPLKEFFNKLHELEDQASAATLPISTSYRAIKWTKMRTMILDELYKRSTIYMQCNKSNGERFPGLWYQMPITKVNKYLPSKTECTIQH